MYHPRLYGSYYDMGLKYGSLLKEKAGFQLPDVAPEIKSFGYECWEYVRDVYPDVAEEAAGFAKGIGTAEAEVGSFLSGLVLTGNAQCSVFAAVTNNQVLVGRNYDMLFAYKKFTESSLVAPAGKYAYVGQSDVFIGRCDGINERGLFIAMTFVNGKEIHPGISFHFVIRKILEEAASLTEARNILHTLSVSSSANYLIADAAGHMAVIEMTPGRYHVRYPSGNGSFISATNHFVSEEMQEHDLGGVEWSQSHLRCNTINNVLSGNGLSDINGVESLLSDSRVCLNLKKEKFGTLWSVACELKSRSFVRAEGRPNGRNFREDRRLEWWLNKRER